MDLSLSFESNQYLQCVALIKISGLGQLLVLYLQKFFTKKLIFCFSLSYLAVTLSLAIVKKCSWIQVTNSTLKINFKFTSRLVLSFNQHSFDKTFQIHKNKYSWFQTMLQLGWYPFSACRILESFRILVFLLEIWFFA